MSDQDQRLTEMLRAAAARAERQAPAFDPDRIVAEAHRRRPWLGLLAALRSRPFTSAPALALATVVLLVVVGVAVLAASHVFSGGGGGHAGGTTSPTTLPTPTTPPPSSTTGPTSTAAPPPTSTTAPTTTTLPPPTSSAPPPTSTTTTVPPTSTTTTTTFFYTARWQGTTVELQHVADIGDLGARHATLVGHVSGFFTDDPNYLALNGDSIDVWRIPSDPGQLFVDNSRQSQSPKGTWTFRG